jgi:hypothetical protein
LPRSGVYEGFFTSGKRVLCEVMLTFSHGQGGFEFEGVGIDKVWLGSLCFFLREKKRERKKNLSPLSSAGRFRV